MNVFIACSTKEEAYKYSSCYGNTYFTITREDIEGLKCKRFELEEKMNEFTS